MCLKIFALACTSQLGARNKLPINVSKAILLLYYGTKHGFNWISFSVSEVQNWNNDILVLLEIFTLSLVLVSIH